jgi:16S rRNA (cytosine1402-N4)-methyltransferase
VTSAPPKPYHEPVMVQEVLQGLAVRTGGRYIDCTLGDGGHASAILNASSPNGRLLGIDADPEAVEVSTSRLAPYGSAATVVRVSYTALASVAGSRGFVPADGVLFDLGISTRQLDWGGRGFSFQRDEPLDMRFDPSHELTADELVNHSNQQELADLIFNLGEEPRARRIARAIVAKRPVASSKELAEIVRRASGYRRSRTHPATRTFQAIRMAVNQELENLAEGLSQAVQVLENGGRLVTIAYHSLEDRTVKEFIRNRKLPEVGPALSPVTKKVIKPSIEELSRNRRCRSARIRVAARVQSVDGV